MSITIEYKNMSFEKREDGVWIHKDWALPGDFGDIYDQPASKELQEKVEAAYQEKEAERSAIKSKVSKSFNPFKTPTENQAVMKSEVKVRRKKNLDLDLDFTKPMTEEQSKTIKDSLKPVKKTNLKGGFNPFKDGLAI
jgi:hypothetical protein